MIDALQTYDQKPNEEEAAWRNLEKCSSGEQWYHLEGCVQIPHPVFPILFYWPRPFGVEGIPYQRPQMLHHYI